MKIEVNENQSEADQKEQKQKASYHLLIDVCDKTRLNEAELMKRLSEEVFDK